MNGDPLVGGAIRARVLAAVNKSRYVPAVGRRSTANVAYVYTGGWSLGAPFDAALLQGMTTKLREANLNLLILDAHQAKLEGETYTHLFLRCGVRGAILRTDFESKHICQAIAAEGFPCVVVAEEFAAAQVCSVFADARSGCRRALEHLVDLGHQRIAIALNVVNDHDHAQRLAIYREVLTAAGLPFNERFVLRLPALRNAGEQALRELLHMRDRPTAIFVADPLPAAGLLQAAQRMNVDIPKQLSVIGFDDTDMRYGTHPQMSAVCQNAEALGGEALQLLQQQMTVGGNSARTRRLECWFEPHETTAPPLMIGKSP